MLIFLIICAFIAAAIGSSRGAHALTWFAVGFCLGPLAWPLAYFTTGKECIYCRSRIHKHAFVCPKCQQPLAPDVLLK